MASSGEGSRGGHVIGHTRAGKPVYEGHGPMRVTHGPDGKAVATKSSGAFNFQIRSGS